MSGSLTVPNNIGAQPGPDVPAALFDQNWATQDDYVNIRQLTQSTLALRPPPGTLTAPDGTWYFATDVNGGTLYASTGIAWNKMALGLSEPVPIPGAITIAETLAGSQAGSYSTTSATFVDVDAVNLKTTVTVPIGAKFILVWASYSLTTGTAVTSGIGTVQILAAGSAQGPYSFCGGILPTTVQSVFAVVGSPPSGSQTIALQFRGDGVNAVVMSNPSAEGYTGASVPVVVPRMMIAVTT